MKNNDRMLLESLIRKYGKSGILNAINKLNEISIYDKYKLEVENKKTEMSFDLFDKLCNLDPTTKPNKVGKFSNWILAKYDQSVDLNELRVALEWYADGIKRNILQREGISPDINKYKSYVEFLSAMQDKMNTGDVELSNSEINNRKKLNDQFEIIGSTDKFEIIKPLTFDAERYFGSGTKWCTVANKRYFDSYTKKSPLYIVYPKNGDNNLKMQFHEQSKSFADKNDKVYNNITNCIFSVLDENDKSAIELRNLCLTIFDKKIIGLTLDEKLDIIKKRKSIPKAIFANSEIEKINIPDGVTSIGDGAFQGCNDLTEIIIPNSVTSIGNNVFYNCNSLTEIIIPNSVTSIGDAAFWFCTSLNEITIPNSVTSIGDGAFRSCSNITSISLPNNITSIGSYIFAYCSNLTEITIPNSVTSIGVKAFYGCDNLKLIKCPKHLANKLKSEYPSIEIITKNITNENMRTRRNNDRMLLESLIRKYGKNGVKNAIKNINESLSGSDYIEAEHIIRILVDNQEQLNKLINRLGEPTPEFERILNVYDEYVLDVFYDILESDDYEWVTARAKRMAEDNEWENGTESSMLINFLTDIANEININIYY